MKAGASSKTISKTANSLGTGATVPLKWPSSALGYEAKSAPAARMSRTLCGHRLQELPLPLQQSLLVWPTVEREEYSCTSCRPPSSIEWTSWGNELRRFQEVPKRRNLWITSIAATAQLEVRLIRVLVCPCDNSRKNWGFSAINCSIGSIAAHSLAKFLSDGKTYTIQPRMGRLARVSIVHKHGRHLRCQI